MCVSMRVCAAGHKYLFTFDERKARCIREGSAHIAASVAAVAAAAAAAADRTRPGRGDPEGDPEKPSQHVSFSASTIRPMSF